MFNNVALDVFIGLVFVYLLYSLLATIIQEILAQWFSLRSRMLIRAMRRMLEDDIIDNSNHFINNSFVGFFDSFLNLFKRFFRPIRKKEKLMQAFYDHPTIKYLGENRLFSKPAYLHSHNFSQTMFHLLHGDEYDGSTQSESILIGEALQKNTLKIKPETLRHLRLLFADSRRDSHLFKLKLEDWFDETMQRCNGWYKKQTQLILIIVGFCLAWAFNVDTIAITKILTKDRNAREQMVQLAISRQNDYGEILDTLFKTTVIKQEVKTVGDTLSKTIETTIKGNPSDKYLNEAYSKLKDDAFLAQGILGLNSLPDSTTAVKCKEDSIFFESVIAREPTEAGKKKLGDIKMSYLEKCYDASKDKSPYQNNDLKIFGWLITALAISLGASFWFDLLNKLISLRGAGTKPNTAADSDTVKNNSINVEKDISNRNIRG